MFQNLRPTPFERIIRGGCLPVDQGTILSGVGRSLRLSHKQQSAAELAVVETSTGFLGPLVYYFVWWVLRRALSEGVQRLYFLARDGELMCKVARVLVEQWALPIEIRYLYCSRESLFLPSVQSVDEFELDWITWGLKGEISWREICARLELGSTEVDDLLRGYGLERLSEEPSTRILPEERKQLRGVLQDGNFLRIVLRGARAKCELVRGYLKQEGLMDGVRFALVDTGWKGSSQFALSRLLGKDDGNFARAQTGFYLGLHHEVYATDEDSLQGFLFDWRQEKVDEHLKNYLCYEMLCSAQHGRTTGYRQGREKIEPILLAAMEGRYARYIELQHQKVLQFVSTVIGYFDFDAFPGKGATSHLCRQLARRLITRPSPEQSDVYGDWPMACELREGDSQVMAPPMRFREFARFSLGLEKVQGYWPQASLQRGGASLLMIIYNLFLSTGQLNSYRRFLLRY